MSGKLIKKINHVSLVISELKRYSPDTPVKDILKQLHYKRRSLEYQKRNPSPERTER